MEKRAFLACLPFLSRSTQEARRVVFEGRCSLKTTSGSNIYFGSKSSKEETKDTVEQNTNSSMGFRLLLSSPPRSQLFCDLDGSLYKVDHTEIIKINHSPLEQSRNVCGVLEFGYLSIHFWAASSIPPAHSLSTIKSCLADLLKNLSNQPVVHERMNEGDLSWRNIRKTVVECNIHLVSFLNCLTEAISSTRRSSRNSKELQSSQCVNFVDENVTNPANWLKTARVARTTRDNYITFLELSRNKLEKEILDEFHKLYPENLTRIGAPDTTPNTDLSALSDRERQDTMEVIRSLQIKLRDVMETQLVIDTLPL